MSDELTIIRVPSSKESTIQFHILVKLSEGTLSNKFKLLHITLLHKRSLQITHLSHRTSLPAVNLL